MAKAKKKATSVGYIYWTGGYGTHAGSTLEDAIKNTQRISKYNGVMLRLTEHDTSVHAIGHKTEETYVRDITVPDPDAKERVNWLVKGTYGTPALPEKVVR